MIYRFQLKDYYDVSYFDIPVKVRLDLNKYEYIRFSSYKNSKIVFEFYRQDVCHCDRKPVAGTILSDTGFFEFGLKHWTQFETFNKRIVYQFLVKENGIIELSILNAKDTFDESLVLDL